MADHALSQRILLLAAAVLAVSMGGIIIQSLLLGAYDAKAPDARAIDTARVSFCINQPPTIGIGDCASNATQNSTYVCQINLSDAGGDAVNVTLVQYDPASEPLLNVTANGSIAFTPTNDDVGAHQITVFAADNTTCANGEVNFTFSLDIANINDAPALSVPLPDVAFPANTTVFPFFLVDYFTDPDGDPMTFESTVPAGITVTIGANSLVSFTAAACNEAGELVSFTAIDPYNATASSNVITVAVACPPPPGGEGSAAGGKGGKGGGGGGGCVPTWDCDEWFACLPAGVQWQHCFDRNGCSADRYLKRTCAYEGPPPACVENWLCDPWSSCSLNETQVRACRDLASCTTSVLRPPLEQSCVYVATCFDGVRNGDETGVDCGGACGVCLVTERPSIVARTWWWLVFLLLALLCGGMLAGYYRTEIARMAATVGFLARHRVKKDILLDVAARKSLFERMNAIERRAGQGDAGARYDALAELIRGYLGDALALPLESTPPEVRDRVRTLGLRHETRQLVEGMLAKLAVIEGTELEDDALFFQASIEEVRTAVCLTSEYAFAELDRTLAEYPVTDGMSFYDEIFARMISCLRAIQYGQIETARGEYLALLARYDPLPPAEQEQIYPELRWLFDVTRLAGSAVGGRVIDKSHVTAV